MDFWYEIAIIASVFAVGNIFLGQFEEKTPKWRRLLKFVLFNILAVVLSFYFGKIGFYCLLGVCVVFFIIVHLWWLPKKGINGWTAEPKDKYYKLRGWKK